MQGDLPQSRKRRKPRERRVLIFLKKRIITEDATSASNLLDNRKGKMLVKGKKGGNFQTSHRRRENTK